MALILAIETSTPVCSIALHNRGELLDSISLEINGAHAERLMRMIEQLLSRNSIMPNELSAVAVSEGPGSYTGLRIGVSTAKGLAFAWDLPLIGVSTLRILAFAAKSSVVGEGFIVALLDARRQEVFHQIFDEELNPLIDLNSEVLEENSYADLLQQKPTYFVGDGAAKVSEVIRSSRAHFLDLKIDASQMGVLAFEKFTKSDFESIAYFVPNYLKEFKALHAKKNPLFI